MENIKWSEEVTNEEFLERIEKKRTLLNNILLRKKPIGFIKFCEEIFSS